MIIRDTVIEKGRVSLLHKEGNFLEQPSAAIDLILSCVWQIRLVGPHVMLFGQL